MSHLVHNEQVKQRSSGIATVGTTFILAGFVVPLVTGHLVIGWPILLNALWVAIGIVLRGYAQGILRELAE